MINVDDLIKGSMKSRNQTELRAYKNLKAEIQAFKTAKNAKPYDEAAEISIIRKYCEKLEKSILSFSEAHREDLVAEYRDELTKKEEKFSLDHDTYDKAVNDYERLNCNKIELEKQLKEVKQKLAEREEYITNLEKKYKSLNKQMEESYSSQHTNNEQVVRKNREDGDNFDYPDARRE